MSRLLVHPDPPPSDLTRILDLTGLPWKAVGSPEAAIAMGAADEWSGAVVEVDRDPETAFAFCRGIRAAESPIEPVLLLVAPRHVAELEGRDDLFDDFCISPPHPREVETRLSHLSWRSGRGARTDLIEYGPLAMNLETYQAAIGGRPLDLTYMEYELLRFLASQPGKVFTREALLSQVWEYDYYGGARTVDVHVRRLRSKLGEEHAGLIQTVRSVGYRFGQSRW